MRSGTILSLCDGMGSIMIKYSRYIRARFDSEGDMQGVANRSDALQALKNGYDIHLLSSRSAMSGMVLVNVIQYFGEYRVKDETKDTGLLTSGRLTEYENPEAALSAAIQTVEAIEARYERSAGGGIL